MDAGDYFLGGKITLLKRKKSKNKLHELTPKQTRKIFSERGWSKVIGFHTRNVIHKSHEFIQLEGMKRSLCDGLFVHPVIGKKKSGDFESEVIIAAYEKMIGMTNEELSKTSCLQMTQPDKREELKKILQLLNFSSLNSIRFQFIYQQISNHTGANLCALMASPTKHHLCLPLHRLFQAWNILLHDLMKHLQP